MPPLLQQVSPATEFRVGYHQQDESAHSLATESTSAGSTAESLEVLAWRVLLLSAKEKTGPQIKNALAAFLALAEIHSATDWASVEAQMQKLVVPILDNDFAYETMCALHSHYQAEDLVYSSSFSWVPRGLLMYGLGKAIEKHPPCTDQQNRSESHLAPASASAIAGPPLLHPKIMLQWLGRLMNDEETRACRDDLIDESLSATSQVLFTLWSCRFDTDPKSRAVKQAVASRKLAHIDANRLVRLILSCSPGPSQYQSFLVLLDFYWLRNFCRLMEANQLIPAQDLGASSGRTRLRELTDSLIADREQVSVATSAAFWIDQKFSQFALEILKTLQPAHEDQDGDELAFIELLSKFLMPSSYYCIEGMEHFRNYRNDRLSTNVCSLAIEVFKSLKPANPLLIKFILSTGCKSMIEAQLPALTYEFCKIRRTEADASMLIRAALTEQDKYIACSDFLLSLGDIRLERETLPLLMAANQCGLRLEIASILSRWDDLREHVVNGTFRPDKMTAIELQETEQIIMLASDLMLGCGDAAGEARFDERILSLTGKLLEFVSGSTRGLERVEFLCLCCCIYIGDPTAKRLRSSLKIRATQLYSLAWALDGMERLWKSNIWSMPRSTSEAPERVLSQAGSVALLSLDNGSLQSVVAQVEQSRPRWARTVNASRRYSLCLDAVVDKRAGWEAHARELSSFEFAIQPNLGDFMPLLGSVHDISVNSPTGGLALLAHRLQGRHLVGATIEGGLPPTFPSSAHFVLEKTLRGLPVAETEARRIKAQMNYKLLNSAETNIRSIRAAL